jgi:hypothetical protein
MKVEERVAALIALVEAERATRCADALQSAHRQSSALLAGARRGARARVRAALAEERAAFAARVASAEARLATTRRMAQQRHLKLLAAAGWKRLPGALAARWGDAEARRAWIDAALDAALAVLPAGTWELSGPPSWAAAERSSAVARLAARAIDAAATTDESIRAGIRVRSGKAVLDATLAGLLADRLLIEGRLLEFFQESRP